MFSLRSQLRHFNRGRIIVITLTLVAIAWILIQQFILRGPMCANKMCPVNDYTYLFRLMLVVAISAIAFWLLRNQKPTT